MATATVKEEPSEEECSICHELFTQPKLLHCGHLLCHTCLISCLKSDAKASCPLCQDRIIKPEEENSGKTIEEFADSLPTDLALEALIESQRALSRDHQCQFCVTQVAKTLCISCGDFYCSSCALGHKRSTSTRHHVVEDLSSLTAEKLASIRPSPCSSHTGEVCKVYCPTHGASLCLLCATTNHRQCTDIMELDSKVKEECAQLEKVAAGLKAEEFVLEQSIQKLNQQLKEMEKNAKEAIAKIDADCDRLESALKTCRHRLKHHCQTMLADRKDAVDTNKTQLMQQLGRLTTHSQVVHHSSRVTRSDVVGPMCLTLKARKKDLSDSCAKLGADAKVAPVEMPVMDPREVSRLEKELLMLCEVRISPPVMRSQEKAPLPFCFHRNHGKDIVLTNSQQTAEKKGGIYGDGIVMSQDAMEVNMLYEVSIDVIDDPLSSAYIFLGVVTQSPDAVALPWWSGDLKQAVVLGPGWIRVNGVQTQSMVGSALPEVREGNRVGLMLDRNRALHWYRDGKHEGEIVSNVASPCYVMIDLCAFWEKMFQVTALPVRRVT